jgi:hypothetical protein
MAQQRASHKPLLLVVAVWPVRSHRQQHSQLSAGRRARQTATPRAGPRRHGPSRPRPAATRRIAPVIRRPPQQRGRRVRAADPCAHHPVTEIPQPVPLPPMSGAAPLRPEPRATARSRCCPSSGRSPRVHRPRRRPTTASPCPDHRPCRPRRTCVPAPGSRTAAPVTS